MARPLTIYIDGACLLRPRDGVGSYVANLLQALLKLDAKNHYIALGFADQKNKPRLVPERANFSYHFLPIPRKTYSGTYRLIKVPVDHFLPFKPDAVWYPNFVATPWIRAGKKIVTIHDLTYLHFADTVEPKNLRYLTRFVPESLQSADVITTVSQSVATEIQTVFTPQAPITAVYPPVPAATPSQTKRQSFILFVSTIEPRKNVRTLLRAYCLLPSEVRKKHQLVLAGREGWSDETTMHELHRLIDQGEAKWVRGPSDADRDILYDTAALFVMPSLYEGFGIPVAEAMGHGLPVITSNDPALTEVSGDAGLHIPANDAAALAKAIESLLSDQTLRQKLVRHIPDQLKQFTNTRSAAAFLDVITQLGEE